MKESILPRMETATQNTVLGGIIKHVSDDKPVAVFGEPGEGKTVTVLDFCLQHNKPSYYYRCSPNTTMHSLLVFIANAIGVRIVGDNDEVQNRIQEQLQNNPDYCFVFDEAEYLANGNGKKLDVIRQIYDATDVPVVICGTYALKDLISGEKTTSRSKKNHNKPQIFRRLRKEEFSLIEESEVADYLSMLESRYAVRFDSKAKSVLISHCRDRQSGGLGNFIEITELLFSIVRPEWEAISHQIIQETGRILHTHKEAAQSFTAIKFDKTDLAMKEQRGLSIEEKLAQSPPKPMPYVDVSKLETVTIDTATLQDALRHKMTM